MPRIAARAPPIRVGRPSGRCRADDADRLL